MQAFFNFFQKNWVPLTTAAGGVASGVMVGIYKSSIGNGFKRVRDGISSIFTKSPKEDKE